MRRRRAALATLTLAAGLAVPVALASAASGPPLTLSVLSGRADLISGGDALVAVGVPAGVDPAGIRVRVGSRDITNSFGLRPNGRYEGLVRGLTPGTVRLLASAPGATAAELPLTDHPIGGPLFAGTQVQPWVCQAGALDAQCDAPPVFTYSYLDAARTGFHAYDPASPPPAAAVATTTTDTGTTVPFIIRQETGYLDRDAYQISVLYQPGKPWAPWAPQPQFDHKLLITHGASCGDDHTTGTPPSTTADGSTNTGSPTTALGLGYAVMSTAADNAGHNCYLVTEAESLLMAKERVIKGYGELRFTIGTGCSGGSLAQQQVANAYPGIYQGILPQCSFPDSWSTGQQLEDYVLLRNYFEHPQGWGGGVAWAPTQINAVMGHPDYANAVELSTLYGPLADPQSACKGVTAAQRWSPSHPSGVRCSLQDFEISMFGPRPDGYAGRPFDNVGAQYGLQALLDGTISAAQFVDLNSRVGSHDINYVFGPARVAADQPALQRGYAGGAINEATNLDSVAIIDLRGEDYGFFHDVYRAFAVRARLAQAHGTYANQVIWEGLAPIIGDTTYTTKALLAMDRWLTAVAADTSSRPLPAKIIADKPSDVVDSCSDGVGQPAPVSVCQAAVQAYQTPRMVAGESIATDIVSCRLVPLSRTAYGPVQFTDAQWTQLSADFPSGVCDYTRPGVAQGPTVPWQTYAAGPGTGHPIGPAPVSRPVGG